MPKREWLLVTVFRPQERRKSITGDKIVPARIIKEWHTRECYEGRMKHLAEIARFECHWPDYCRECGGTGVIHWRENRAPHGSGHYWPEPMTDTCGDCVGLGNCPRCGLPIDEEQDADDYFTHEFCGWTDRYTFEQGHQEDPGAPMHAPIDYECHCWRHDEECELEYHPTQWHEILRDAESEQASVIMEHINHAIVCGLSDKVGLEPGQGEENPRRVMILCTDCDTILYEGEVLDVDSKD